MYNEATAFGVLAIVAKYLDSLSGANPEMARVSGICIGIFVSLIIFPYLVSWG